MYHASLTAALRRTIRCAVVAGALAALPAAAVAQQSRRPAPAAGDEKTEGAADAVEAAMARTMTEGVHVRLSKLRPGTHADTVRVQIMADALRAAIGKYQDTSAAVGDGYKMFAPQLKEQPIYHFTNWMAGFKAAFTFDATRPTSLLYVKEANGNFKLVGAMYTAPKRASEAELDKRVPLSIARWHRHVMLCLTKKGDEKRYAELKDGHPLFGTEGTIATEAACKAAGGRWFVSLFGWMVHANVFSGHDVASVWGAREDPERH